MKKIIDGKLYDTQTSECIAYYNNGLSCNDFNYLDRDLMVTKKGNFFFYDSDYQGNKIRLENYDEEFKEFMEEYGTVEDYIKYFGEVEEA